MEGSVLGGAVEMETHHVMPPVATGYLTTTTSSRLFLDSRTTVFFGNTRKSTVVPTNLSRPSNFAINLFHYTNK